MFIAVEPRMKLKLADLHLDKRKLQYFNRYPPSKRGYTGYYSRDGLVVGLYKDTIVQVFYIAGESDQALCLDYYGRPESFVEIPVVHVPVVDSIQGPSSIRAGERLKLLAMSNLNETLGYTWTLTAGRIIGGQYTNQIMIDTTGLAGQKITITAEIEHAFGVRALGSTVVDRINAVRMSEAQLNGTEVSDEDYWHMYYWGGVLEQFTGDGAMAMFGVPAPGDTALTVAVNVTDWPKVEGLAEEATAVLLFALFTVCVKSVEVLVLKLPSPL